jgi:tetratricopeptide (TPR) repeat protein
MSNNERVTAVLLVAAFTAVACSKPFEETKTQQQLPAAAQAKLAALPEAIDPEDEEGTGGSVSTRNAGPVSFADGDAAYQAKNYGEAVTLFEQYTERRPNNAWGHFMLGLAAWKAGDLPKAEGAFEESLKVDPNHLKSLVNLSRVLIDQRRFDDALVRLTHAGEVDSSSVDVQRLLGRVYAAQHKTDDAVNAYRRAIALDARDAWSMNNLGLLYLDEERAGNALPLLARAVMVKSDAPEFQNNLGMALEHTGRFRAAANAYRNALAADRGYVKAQQNLARVEAVKVNGEEPFDLEATAEGAVEVPQISDDAATVAR